MGRRELDVASSAMSDASSPDYAPSPNTCSAALTRATQVRLQSLLRNLLEPKNGRATDWKRQRLDTLRVLRKDLRELNFQLTWLSQVDLLETMERLVRDDDQQDHSEANKSNNIHLSPAESSDWRLVNEATQLLSEAIPQFTFDVDIQTLCPLLAAVIENLGHAQSEVRRSSLLLINMYINERPAHFKHLLKLFIDYGLANHRNPEAQRGAILSLPLLMTAQVVKGEDLLPLLRCLSELLVEADAQLFYSLYLALQRLHLTLGDRQFHAYLRQCDPEALLLYKQAASRSNSLALNAQEVDVEGDSVAAAAAAADTEPIAAPATSGRTGESIAHSVEQKQVSFSRNSQQRSVRSESPEVVGEVDDDDGRAAETSPELNSADERHLSAEEVDDTPRMISYTESQTLHKDKLADSPIRLNGSSSGGSSNSNNNNTNQVLVRQVSTPRSSVSSTCSSRAHLVDPSHYMTAAALAGKPLADYEQLHKRSLLDHSSTGLAINDLSACCTPTMELGPGAGHELRFGIFPRHLVAAALSAGRSSDRVEAMQEMMCLIRESPINHLAILITYFDSFLDQFLSQLIGLNATTLSTPSTGNNINQQQVTTSGQSDFKVSLIAIDMIETIVIKSKASTLHYVRPLVALLVRALADNRSRLFRDNSARVLHKLMSFLPPQHVIDALFEHKHHRSAQVREEAVNRITAAVLHYHRDEFNLTKLCYHVLPMLADHSGQVRLAALECIAVLAHALGQERIGSLLTAAEAVQTGAEFDGLLEAIQARLQRRQLPRCNPTDGLVRPLIKPFLNPTNQSFHLEHQAADVRWVLEAPSTHQHQHQQHVSVSPLPHSLNASAATAQVHLHHAHRPGAYSPPRDLAQRRCSMAVLSQELHELQHPTGDAQHSHAHQHHHHQHNRNHHLEESTAATGNAKQSTVAPAETIQRRASVGAGRQAQQVINNGSRGSTGESAKVEEDYSENVELVEPIKQRRESRVKPAPQMGSSSEVQNRQQQQYRQPALQLPIQRSNSQDSISSSDSNKVLFQYYLSKFKQSLTDPTNGTLHPVLPSDSIIYTDTAQAYALSRHQSRQQQTSFDYDSDSVGRIPDSSGAHLNHNQVRPAEHESQRPSGEPTSDNISASGAKQQQFYRHQRNQKQQQRSEQVNSSSGVDSPPTVLESMATEQHRDSTRGSREEDVQTTEVARNRRKSISRRSQDVPEKQQQQQDSRRKSVVGADSSAHQVQRRDSRSSEKDMSSPKTPEPLRQRMSSHETMATEEPTKRSGAGRLVRQSASVAVPVELHSASSTASTVTSRTAARNNDLESSTLRRSAPQSKMSHQDSATASSAGDNSESMRNNHQPDTCSDSATQTAQPQSDDNEEVMQKRESSIHRKSRRSSRQRKMSSSKSHDDHDFEVANELSNDEGESHRHVELELRRRASRSQPPAARHRPQLERKASRSHTPRSGVPETTRRAVSVSPSLASNVNIRHILENVAQLEGPFQEPQLAFKVALDALDGPCWSTKVEGLLALIRLAAYHQPIVIAHLHEVIARTVVETRNLRSTVARSAIFALGDFSAKLKRAIEPELETIVQALLQRSSENTAFIRDDIRRALISMLDNLTHWRLANALIHHGANHKNMHVRRMTSQFVALLVERMGAAKCLVGARDISVQLLPAAAKFAQDSSPHTRYYGRLILVQIMQHSAFERLLRKLLTPNLYRSTIGIIESVKRRGPGEPPADG